MRDHKSPLHDSLQKAASELIMEEERQYCGQGNEEGEAGAER